MYDKSLPWVRRSRFFAAFVLLPVLCACSSNEEFQQQFRLEKIYFRAQKIADTISINPRIAPAADFANAISLFHQVVKEADTKPASPKTAALVKQSLVKMAQLEMMQDRVDAAIQVYQEILQRFQADDDMAVAARLALGLLYERSLEYRDAIDAYSGLLPNFSSRIEPQDPDGYLIGIPFQFARLHKFAIDDSQSRIAYEQASEIYEQIINKWSNSKAGLLATNYLAAILADQGRWDELNTLIDEQMRNNSDTTYVPEFLYLKALLLHGRLRQPGLAMQLFQEILSKYPTHEIVPRVRLEIARITLEQNNYHEARHLLKLIVDKHRNVPAVAALAQEEVARSFEMEGRWDLAINEYRWLARQYETFPSALAAPIHIAHYYTKRNDTKLAEKAFGEAIEYYQGLIRKYPQSLVAALAQEQIANCFIVQKKWEEAITAASNIRNVLDNNAGRISTYLLLGNIYESTGQYRLAVKIYNEFIDQFPQHPLARSLQEKVRSLMNS